MATESDSSVKYKQNRPSGGTFRVQIKCWQ